MTAILSNWLYRTLSATIALISGTLLPRISQILTNVLSIPNSASPSIQLNLLIIKIMLMATVIQMVIIMVMEMEELQILLPNQILVGILDQVLVI
jgi:hypothetical protein